MDLLCMLKVFTDGLDSSDLANLRTTPGLMVNYGLIEQLHLKIRILQITLFSFIFLLIIVTLSFS